MQKSKLQFKFQKFFQSRILFFILKSAFLNLPRKFRETETDQREFPRALNFIGLVSTADVSLNEKIRDKI